MLRLKPVTLPPVLLDQVVVHCWGGGKRSGSALAAWLVAHHNLSPEAAVDEVNETSAGQGSTRAADLQQVKQLLSATGAKL
jgi:protein-tyrosine phosphatase